MFLLLMAFDAPTVLQAEETFMPGAGEVEWTLYQGRDAPEGWPEDPGLGRWLHLRAGASEWVVPGHAAEEVVRGPGVSLLALGMTGFAAIRTLGIVDDDLVIVSELWSDRYSATELDWQLRYGRWEDGLGGQVREGALIVAQRWAYEPARVPTWCVWGERDGDEDADLLVNAQATDQGVDLRLRVMDDIWIPPTGPGDHAMVRSDHIEIWLGSDRQLGVELTEEPQARWLLGEGPLPSVRWDEGVLVVSLSSALLGPGRGPPESTGAYTEWVQPLGTVWAMTVVFSDSDGGGQEALVATSTLRYRDPATLGQLVLFPDAARFPQPPGAVRL